MFRTKTSGMKTTEMKPADMRRHCHRRDEKVKPPPKIFTIPPDIDCPPFFLPLHSLDGSYRVISDLGTGSFGSVALAKSTFKFDDSSKFRPFHETLLARTDRFRSENLMNKKSGLVAIKTMKERLPKLNDYMRVKEVMFILDIPYHINLVQIYEMFIDNVNFKLHIVMEVMDRSLHQLVRGRRNIKFSHSTMKSILSQVLNGIRHIHRNGYFHRDVKPENILVSPTKRFYEEQYIESGKLKYRDNFVVKIADYGLSRRVDSETRYTSYVATRWYRAPEILLRKNWYSRPVDIWAFGTIAAEVANLRPLFPGENEIHQIWQVVELLGTPSSNNGLANYYPSYGYWDEATYLFSLRQLPLPENRCIDISRIVTSSDSGPLCDVVRACLTWDPNVRPDVDQICEMSYFRGTCVDVKANSGKIPSSSIPEYPTKNTFSNSSMNFQKSERLAGIPPQKAIFQVQHPPPMKEKLSPLLNLLHDTATSTFGSTPTDLTFSFLKDLDVKPAIMKKQKPQNQFLDASEMFHRAETARISNDIPSLSQEISESLSTNDENLNAHEGMAFHKSYLQGNNCRDGLKLIENSSNAAPMHVPSFIDYNLNGNSPTYRGNPDKMMFDHEYFNPDQHFDNYGYDYSDQHLNAVDISTDLDDLLGTSKLTPFQYISDGFVPRSIPDHDIKDSNTKNLLDSKVRYSDRCEESLTDHFGKKAQVVSQVTSLESHDEAGSEFSSQLYSNFNLRQTGVGYAENASLYLPEVDSFEVR